MATGTISQNKIYAPTALTISAGNNVVIENYSYKKVGKMYFLSVRLHSTVQLGDGSQLFTFTEPTFTTTTPLATNGVVPADVTGNQCRNLKSLSANTVLTLNGAFCV